jgi:hypothetical protein
LKEQLKKILFLITFIFLLACSKERPQTLNFSDKDKRYDLPGFSMMQPQEGSWSLSSKTNDEIVFVSRDKFPLETFVAKASIMHLRERYTNEEFKQFIESKFLWGEKDTTKRFSVIKEEYSVSNEMNTYCVRYQTTAQDYSPKVPANEDYFILEASGFVCRHPENINIITTFDFSSRYLPQSSPVDFSSRATQFFKNIKFESLYPHANILTYGLYKKNSNGKSVKVEGTENEYVQTAGFNHIETTRDIPAKLGTYFGFEVELFDLPPGEEIKLDIYVTHPPLKMNVGAAISTEDSYWLRTTVPEDGSYKSAEWFGLTKEEELIPGKWVYQYYLDKKLLLEQEFIVYDLNKK